MYFYSENEIRSKNAAPFRPESFDATQMFATHFYNAQVLMFLAKNETIYENKRQAEKELLIAERKMKYWRCQANFNQDTAIELCNAIKKKMKK